MKFPFTKVKLSLPKLNLPKMKVKNLALTVLIPFATFLGCYLVYYWITTEPPKSSNEGSNPVIEDTLGTTVEEPEEVVADEGEDESDSQVLESNLGLNHQDTYGTIEYTNGVYEGSLKNGVEDGQGTLTYNDGGKYVGEWKNGLKSGNGTFYFSNGDKYTGEWVSGKRSGSGTYYYSIGDRYVGQWNNDYMNGQGIYYYVNGTSFLGEWINDKYIDTPAPIAQEPEPEPLCTEDEILAFQLSITESEYSLSSLNQGLPEYTSAGYGTCEKLFDIVYYNDVNRICLFYVQDVRAINDYWRRKGMSRSGMRIRDIKDRTSLLLWDLTSLYENYLDIATGELNYCLSGN